MIHPCLPKESIGFPGYYDIPGYSRYCITNDGKLLNKQTLKTIHGYKFINYHQPERKDCYVIYQLIDDSGKPHKIPRHRLVALVFKYPGIIFVNLDVNHINGIKGDDRSENLEWVTQKENSIHAFKNGLISRTKKQRLVSVRNSDTGEIIKYQNVNECARSLGLTVEAVLWRVHKGEKYVFPERKQYRASHSNNDWYIPEDVDLHITMMGNDKCVIIKNVFTNEEHSFGCQRELSTFLKMSPGALTRYVKDIDKQPLIDKKYLLKSNIGDNEWRRIEDIYLELDTSDRLNRVIKVINDKTGEEHIFLSAIECAKHFGILPTTLDWRLKSKGSIVYKDGHRYGYYSDLIGPTNQ